MHEQVQKPLVAAAIIATIATAALFLNISRSKQSEVSAPITSPTSVPEEIATNSGEINEEGLELNE